MVPKIAKRSTKEAMLGGYFYVSIPIDASIRNLLENSSKKVK